MSEARKFLFPWICIATGAFFFVEDWTPITYCPICEDEPDAGESGALDAFESGHCKRKFAESFFKDERRGDGR